MSKGKKVMTSSWISAHAQWHHMDVLIAMDKNFFNGKGAWYLKDLDPFKGFAYPHDYFTWKEDGKRTVLNLFDARFKRVKVQPFQSHWKSKEQLPIHWRISKDQQFTDRFPFSATKCHPLFPHKFSLCSNVSERNMIYFIN